MTEHKGFNLNVRIEGRLISISAFAKDGTFLSEFWLTANESLTLAATLLEYAQSINEEKTNDA